MPVAEAEGATTIICKATDAAHNSQPESVAGIWNLRGLNNNSWHRVPVDQADEHGVKILPRAQFRAVLSSPVVGLTRAEINMILVLVPADEPGDQCVSFVIVVMTSLR